MKRNLLISLVLVAITLVVYAPVRNFDFVSFDDPLYVRDNPHVAAGLTADSMRWAVTADTGANWNPVTWFSHMLDVEMFGPAPGLPHVTSLLLHIASTLLLFTLLLRMTEAVYPSALVAALFAIHPLHVESVAWLSERKDVLSTFFGFLALHAYVSYVRKPDVGRYLLVAGMFALSLMSKPMLVTLPFVLLLLDVWPLNRKLRNVIWEKVPLLAMTVAISVVTFLVQSEVGTVVSTTTFSPGQRIANAIVSYVRYLARAAWPAHLAAFYPYEDLSLIAVAGSAILLLAVTAFVLKFCSTHRYLFTGWFWYLGTLVPVIGLVQVGEQSSADRYTYVPLIGVFVMVVFGLERLIPKGKPAAVVAIAVLGFVSMRQVQSWKDSYSLWSHALDVTTENHFAHVNLGLELQTRGDLTNALSHFEEAVRIKPMFAEAQNALGFGLMKVGRLDEAMSHYREAVRLRPDFGLAHNNVGMLLAQQGQLGEATVEFLEAVRLDPDNPEIHANLGLAFAGQGRFDEAIQHYERSLKLRPDAADVHNKFGSALYSVGKVNEAIAQYQAAIQLDGRLFEPHSNLGLVYQSTQRYEDSIREFNEAIRIAPQDAEAYNGLGITLAMIGKLDEAIATFQAALKVNPNHLQARQNLQIVEAKMRER